MIVSKLTKWGIVILILFILYVFVIPKDTCRSKNPIITDPVTGQPVKEIPINDSDVIYKQLFYKAQYEKQLAVDSFTMLLIKAGKISPETVIKWRDNYIGQERSILLQDSLSSVMSRVLEIQKQNMEFQKLTAEEKAKLQKEKEELLAIRIPFKDSSKYRELQGNIGFNGKLNITKDITRSEPYVIIGEKKKLFNFGPSEYNVVLGNKNPTITSDSIISVTYRPKAKVQYSVGPMILGNQKSITGGFGVTAKRGILSVSVGYTVINKNFK